ncbi:MULTISPECIES: hypothetical protein [unclassified Mesorhizobium]|uniref:hypothetical protein n=1 Tax=unclassified Mesorhizobium TaxID=325217 RepID=UPI00333B5A92
MRDLIHEGRAYLDGAAYDPVILGLAAIGLTITVATVTTLGATTPARVGATVLKAPARAAGCRSRCAANWCGSPATPSMARRCAPR